MAIISPGQTAFLKFEIENGDARRRKVALQEISKRYRRGDQFNAPNRNSFEKLINGIVLADRDKKVVRWCLNALARLGTRQNSSRYVTLALQQHGEDPEIVASAIAALSQMYNGSLDLIPELNSIDPAIKILAAMQTTDPRKLDLSELIVDIDKSDTEVLKLALLTVGLNRDIQNLLHPRHSNGQIVKQLCQHDDRIVKQYSVWSVMENKRLTLGDLGICFDHINKEPINVQSKLLQLAAEREPDLVSRRQIIHDGIFNEHPEARIGLATGIRHVFFEGLEELTVNWFDAENDLDVRNLIAEHFGRFSGNCPSYFDKSVQIAEADPGISDRILLGAEGKPLYSAIRSHSGNNGIGNLFGNQSDLNSMFHGEAHILGKTRRMKILFLAANPGDQTSLRIDQEARDLKEQIALVRETTVNLEVEHAWAVRTDQIQREILNAKPEVLHFSGHGGPGLLVFENNSGASVEVSGETMANLVELVPSIKCVILNACYSESVAKLVAPHVEAVIGCNVSIDDDAANYFTRAFYRALAHGQDIRNAFLLAKNEVSLNGKEKESEKYKMLS